MFKSRVLSQTAALTRRAMSSEEPDIIFKTIQNAGVVTLNRPKALNSLNISMVTKLLEQLREWEDSKHLVIMKGAGSKAFSTGGDVMEATDQLDGPRLFHSIYNVKHLISKYKIPFVTIIDGITIGVSLGMAGLGRYRVATEKTIIEMPETKIGIFGGTYFLSKLQNNLGLYIGLTGDTLVSTDVVKAGIATHFLSSNRLNELEKVLSSCTSEDEVQSSLNKINEPSDEFSLAPNIKHINYCFAALTVEEIIERLEKVQNDWSIKTLQTLHQRCPGSLKTTMRALQRGTQLDIPQYLKMEYRLLCHAIRSHDFREGVRAFLIDKDNNPQWNPKTLAKVDDDYLERLFKNLPEDQELKLFDSNSYVKDSKSKY